MKLGYILFALTLILQPIAQILQKTGIKQIGEMNHINQLFEPSRWLHIAINPFIVGGVSVAAISLMFYLGALSTMKVSYLYPLGSISYIVLALLAHFILKEPISQYQWVGVCSIILGCYLLQK